MSRALSVTIQNEQSVEQVVDEDGLHPGGGVGARNEDDVPLTRIASAKNGFDGRQDDGDFVPTLGLEEERGQEDKCVVGDATKELLSDGVCEFGSGCQPAAINLTVG